MDGVMFNGLGYSESGAEKLFGIEYSFIDVSDGIHVADNSFCDVDIMDCGIKWSFRWASVVSSEMIPTMAAWIIIDGISRDE